MVDVVAIGTISLSGDPALITIVDTSVHDCALQYININICNHFHS
jgi:hypothetical protein